MKAKECTLKVCDSWGQLYPLIQCKSISEAKRKGWKYVGGFYFRVVIDRQVVYGGFCKRTKRCRNVK
jgi:hypothetical protein